MIKECIAISLQECTGLEVQASQLKLFAKKHGKAPLADDVMVRDVAGCNDSIHFLDEGQHMSLEDAVRPVREAQQEDAQEPDLAGFVTLVDSPAEQPAALDDPYSECVAERVLARNASVASSPGRALARNASVASSMDLDDLDEAMCVERLKAFEPLLDCSGPCVLGPPAPATASQAATPATPATASEAAAPASPASTSDAAAPATPATPATASEAALNALSDVEMQSSDLSSLNNARSEEARLRNANLTRMGRYLKKPLPPEVVARLARENIQIALKQFTILPAWVATANMLPTWRGSFGL